MMIQAVWVEFPVKNLERAMRFYQTIFGLEPTKIDVDDVRRTTTLVNPSSGGAGISLNQTQNFEPSDKGVLVYLFAGGDDLTPELNRVVPAGGKIVEPKTSMGPAGFYATVQDTEGNVFALYPAK
jgi:hypothetical protein